MPIAFNPLLPGPETRAPSVRVRGRTPPDVLVTPVSVDRAHNHTGLELVVGDPGTLTSSDFDGSKPTKILIHGWLGDAVDYESVCMMLKAGGCMRSDKSRPISILPIFYCLSPDDKKKKKQQTIN
jgi:hypothetical protein